MRSFNSKMGLNNVSQLKHIPLSKHIHYCIQSTYHVYYTTQWNFINVNEYSQMNLTSPNEKWMRLADIVRSFCHFLLWKKEYFTLMWWVILILRKLLQTSMHWQNRSFLTLESLTFHCFFRNSVTMLFISKNACSDVIGAFA